MKQCAEIFPLPPLEQKVLQAEFSYLQDMFIITKAWDYFWPHFEKQDGCHGCFLNVMDLKRLKSV